MKTRFAARPSLFTLAIVFVLGCAAQAVTTHAISAAQTDPARNVYRECFVTTLYHTTGRSLNQGEIPELVTIPAGWHVVAGGAQTAVLCR